MMVPLYLFTTIIGCSVCSKFNYEIGMRYEEK